jgi:dihydroorotase
MIRIANARTPAGETKTLTIQSHQDADINASGLLLLPGLIDPHVHFRTPGFEQKENWQTGARAAIAGGYTTVFDMPNTLPPTISHELLIKKKQLIDAELKSVGIPLRYGLYFGADQHHIDEIHKVKNEVVGIKIFMAESTGNLVVDNDEALHAVFAIAAAQHMLVAVHAEDPVRIKERTMLSHQDHYAAHSTIRDEKVAARAVEKAISLAKLYGTRLYVLHVSTTEEIQLVRAAKAEGLPVFAEVTPHHLFLNVAAYTTLGGKAMVNPPLREAHHQQALFEAIHDGTIDTVGSDHAPHLPHEKAKPYGSCPCGMPGIETTLPLLITAYQAGQLTLEQVVSLTHDRAREIFNLPLHDDIVLVDTETPRTVNHAALKTKCQWSAFEGWTLRGWPKWTIVNGCLYANNP